MEMARLSEDDAAREDKLYRHFGDNRLLQNDLPGCRVVLFPRQAAYLFLIIGFTFLLIGLYVERMSSDIHEIRVRYDDVCRTTSSNTSSLSPPPCQLQVKIPEDLSQPVFVYYSLEEFFQNHRGYITSFSAAQISGEMISESDARKTCSPAAFNGSPHEYVFTSHISTQIHAQMSEKSVLRNTNRGWDTYRRLHRRGCFINEDHPSLRSSAKLGVQ
mmetsp:Transcript_45527/g.73206  ORF Transcript_45527/g.73206 Transcript_45527/m.73206 type:complete len:216 (-) Transcript_45527:794-1441(-)